MLKELIITAFNDYKQLLKNKRWMAVVLFLFFIVCISLSVYRVIIYMSDFNMFLDPAVDAKFFEKDPITTWTNNSYSPFFYSVMSIFSPFARWFAVILWSLISILSLMAVYSITKFFFPSLKTRHYTYVFFSYMHRFS